MPTDGSLDLHIRARMDQHTEALLAWRRAACQEIARQIEGGEPASEVIVLVSLLTRGVQLVDAAIEAHPTTRGCDVGA